MLCKEIDDEGLKALRDASLIVLGVGINQDIESEGRDRFLLPGRLIPSESILLPEGQRRLISLILEQTRCDVILVYFSGCGALDLSAYEADDRVIGILSAGYTGMFGGTAVAEILVGKVNPSAFPPRA